MSINTSLSSDGLEELYTPPTLKEMCLYKCVTNKDILTKEVGVDEDMDGSQSEKLDWEKFRLKELIQRELVEALLDMGEKNLFMLTPKYVPVLAAIRMSQPDHLVKVHVSNTDTLNDCELEFLISGGNVKSLDIHGCESLGRDSLEAINKYGRKLEYLQIGGSEILPGPEDFEKSAMAILRTPNLKTFIMSEIGFNGQSTMKMSNYWKFLVLDFISNLEDLQISLIHKFPSLEFLEPAKSKLTSLTLSYCVVTKNANAWASLFKLDKLRSLDLVGSSIGKAFVGEDVVQRLLTAMPNLTHLAVDPGLVKDIYVGASIRGQGSMAKRLQSLGIMDNDEVEIRKAKLLANDVAYFGTVDGELRILEYFSNLVNWGFSGSPFTLDRLLNSLILVNPTPPWKTVAIISLLLKTIKNMGLIAVSELFFSILKKLLTTDVAAKMGKVLLDQCIETISAYLRRWSGQSETIDTVIIRELVDIIMNLDAELRLDHYVTVVPTVMLFIAESDEIPYSILNISGIEGFQDLKKKIAQLLEKVVDRFPGEINELWGISSVLEIIKKFKMIIVSDADEHERSDLVEIFSNMIASVRKLCLSSSPRRKDLYCHGGVKIVIDLLTEINDDCVVGWADGDSLALLEILKSILQDTKLDLSKSAIVVSSGLEKLLISVYSKWQLWKSSNADGDNTHYIKMKSIASLLNYLESDPRFDYKISAAVKSKLILVNSTHSRSMMNYNNFMNW